MISSHTLTVFPRQKTGSRYAQRDRAAGRLPAILYGHGQTPLPLSLDAKQALRHFHLGEKVFSINLEGEAKSQTVMIKDLQFDYLGTNVIHVDLSRVDLNEEIDANVPVRLVGEAAGLKHAGSILTHPSTEIHVRCTVATLPDHVEISIADLEVGQTLHAREILLPPGVTLLSDPEASVASITITKVQEEPEEGEAAAVEDQEAEPEVITEKKEGEPGKAEGSEE